MSRCLSCNAVLNDFEATRKFTNDSGDIEYLDMCSSCLSKSNFHNVSFIERDDLASFNNIDEDDSYGDDVTDND